MQGHFALSKMERGWHLMESKGRSPVAEPILAETRALRVYAATITIVLLAAVLMGFSQNQRTHFAEIDVERINVVEKDGRVRLVIANLERSPAPVPPRR